MFSEIDYSMMQLALAQAQKGLFNTTPNPRVGCVIVQQGQIIGEGFTQPAGGAHAEVQALSDCKRRGHNPAGATVYVTLEPCSHFGKTPPCVNALIEANVARVVAAIEDPNPHVSGSGLKALRNAGIEVRCGLLQSQAHEINIGFISRMTRQRPWVRMKLAASMDGFTALPDGTSQWITDEAARADGHFWRARACAVLTGIGTVRDDDPQMTVRQIPTDRQPLRVLIDSRLEVSLEAKLLKGGARIYTASHNADKERELIDRGCEVIYLPQVPDDINALVSTRLKVDLLGVLTDLASIGINELHVEAGAKLNGSLLRDRCIDELVLYTAPMLIGAGAPLFEMLAINTLQQAQRWEIVEAKIIAPDLRVIYRHAPLRVAMSEPVSVS